MFDPKCLVVLKLNHYNLSPGRRGGGQSYLNGGNMERGWDLSNQKNLSISQKSWKITVKSLKTIENHFRFLSRQRSENLVKLSAIYKLDPTPSWKQLKLSMRPVDALGAEFSSGDPPE